MHLCKKIVLKEQQALSNSADHKSLSNYAKE